MSSAEIEFQSSTAKTFWFAFATAYVAVISGIAWIAGLLTLLLTSPPADQFVTSTFELTLAPSWTCAQEGGEYVCSPSSEPPLDAIAIIALKYRGDEDSLKAYRAHLETPKPMEHEDRHWVSKVKYVRDSRIAGHRWIDGLHLGSEVPGFFTRYLATVTSHVGLAVTLTAREDRYQDYVGPFDKMIDSLVIYQSAPKNRQWE